MCLVNFLDFPMFIFLFVSGFLIFYSFLKIMGQGFLAILGFRMLFLVFLAFPQYDKKCVNFAQGLEIAKDLTGKQRRT